MEPLEADDESSCPVAQGVETGDKPRELPLVASPREGGAPVAFAELSSEEGASLLEVEKNEGAESFARSSAGEELLLLLEEAVLGAAESALELVASVCCSPRTV